MLGNYLVSENFVTTKELNEALNLQRFKKDKIGRILVELGYLSEESLDSALMGYLNPICLEKVADLIKMRESVLISEKIPENEKTFLKSNKLEIIKLRENEITLVASKYNDQTIKKAENVFNRDVVLKLVLPEVFSLLDIESRLSNPTKITLSRNLTDEQKLAEDNPYSKLIRESIDEALRSGASDIHYEPFDATYVIRFRIHGVLSDWKVLPGSHAKATTAKLKSILNMDLAIIGRPQDSRASFKKRQLDVRASSFPVLGNREKIVLRLQRQDEIFALEKLGLPPKPYHALLNAIQKRDGLILISGPTGSGKTTTLYSLLRKMDERSKNISTLENPVEKKLDRINQANISDYKIFSNFERALMRQDPDIILVGEIRDQKNAQLCMRLAATGHLVLSTIHASGAARVIERLKNLGIDDFSIKSNLRLSVAQRLTKKICPFCSEEASEELIVRAMRATHLKEMLPNSPNNFKKTHREGCQKCKQGLIGRMAVMEYLEKDEIQSCIDNKNLLPPKISLESECLRVASLGTIDTEEVVQVS